MRILVLANKFPYPPKDGGSIATLSLARSLAAAGHVVTILAMNTSKHHVDPSMVPAELASLIRFIGVPVDTGIRKHRLVVNFFFSKLPYNAERFVSEEFSEKLRSLLTREKFDIIQLEGLYLAPYMGLIRANSAAKVVMRAHNVEHEIWQRAVKNQGGPKKLYLWHLARRIRAMEFRHLNDYDAVLPITARDGEILKQMGCRLPSHVVPTGIDAGQFAPSSGGMEYPSVFHIGALDWIPNQEGLIWFFDNVWALVLEKHPELQFYLAGRNAPGHFRSLPYPNLHFLGEVEDAYDFMRAKAIMIVPILSGSGMRIKIIEGMAMGKAIVTTTIGTEGIATSHGENILVADSAEGFADAVARLASNHDYCMKIGENARKFVAGHYDNKVITASLTQFYENLAT